MSSREKTQKPTDMERDRHRADTVEENELRRSQLPSLSQISVSQLTLYMIYMVVTGL
jgi:hypothetical protein